MSTALWFGERLTATHFRLIAEAGFEVVEIVAHKPHFDLADESQIGGVVKNLARYGLSLNSLHSAPDLFFGKSQDVIMERLKEELRALQRFGGGIHVIHPSELASPDNPVKNEQGEPNFNLSFIRDIAAGGEAFRAMKQRLSELTAYAKETGSMVALENAGRFETEVEVVEGAVRLLSETNLDNIGVCFDTGHANRSQNAEYILESVGEMVITTHLHDNHGSMGEIVEDEHLLPFFGTVEWGPVLGLLKETGYEGVLLYEPLSFNQSVSLGELKLSLSRMRSLWDKL